MIRTQTTAGTDDVDIERSLRGGGSGSDRRAVLADDQRGADHFKFAAAFSGREDVLALLPAKDSQLHFFAVRTTGSFPDGVGESSIIYLEQSFSHHRGQQQRRHTQ